MPGRSRPEPDADAPLKPIYCLDDIPVVEREQLQRLAGETATIRAVVHADILPGGQYGRSTFVLADGQMLVVAGGRVQRKVSLDDVGSVQCRDFVGNGLLEVRTTAGRRIELIRFSRTLSDAFQEIADRINRDLRVDEDEIEAERERVAKISGPKEEKPTYRCPNCGHPLAFPSDACPKCTNKRRIIMRLFRLLARHRLIFWVGTALGLLVVGVNLAPAYLVRLLLDKVLVPADLARAVRLQRLNLIVGCFLALVLFRLVTSYFRIRLMGVLAARMVLGLRRDLYRSLQRLSLSYYDREHTGRIMSRVLTDTANIQQFVVSGVQQLILHGIMVVAIPVILLVADWRLALVALAPIPLVVVLGRIFSHRFNAIYRTLRRRFANLSAAVSDTVSGVRVVKSFAQEDREAASFDAKAEECYDAHVSTVRTRARFNPVVTFVMALATLAVWFVGGRSVIRGPLEVGMLVLFISYMNQLYSPVQVLLTLTETFQSSATAAERVFNIMDMPSEVADHDRAVALERIEGRIVFDHVSFSYTSGERVLKNIDFTVEPGEMIGLVGQTGSGKSTLVSLVCRFYEPTRGRITLDGTDLCDIRLKSLRSNIGMVLQESFLFAGTIRENIAYETAPGHRPRHPPRPGHPHPRRGHLGRRHGHRTGHPGSAQPPRPRPDDDRHRAPPLDAAQRR